MGVFRLLLPSHMCAQAGRPILSPSLSAAPLARSVPPTPRLVVVRRPPAKRVTPSRVDTAPCSRARANRRLFSFPPGCCLLPLSVIYVRLCSQCICCCVSVLLFFVAEIPCPESLRLCAFDEEIY